MPLRLPVSGGAAPEPPPDGGLGPELWARGQTFHDLVARAGAAREELEAAFAATRVDPATHAFLAAYPHRVRVLAVCDLDAVDSRINVAQIERLFTCSKNLWLRIFVARENPDLRRRFASAALPLCVFFGQDRREFARWGPRPQALQESAADSVRHDFYARSRGQDLARELCALLAAHAG